LQSEPLLVLGVDGGGSKTVCVLLDAQRRELARGEGGPSDHYTVGSAEARASLGAAIRSALDARHMAADSVLAICLGMAGVDRPEDELIIQQMVREIIAVPRVRVVNDAVIALVGGVGRAYGVAIIAGTGSVAYGINARGQARRAGGWGYLLGDEGSGYDIGRRAMQAALRAHDGRGQATCLLPMLLTHLNLERIEDLMALIHLQGFQRHQIAALVPLVEQAVKEGDPVALDILRGAAEELSLGARAVIQGLEMQDETFDAVLVGGVFKTGVCLLEHVRRRVLDVARRAKVTLPRHEPAVGAALLALDLVREV
jgi:N-acetylglucosamine kinase